VGETLAEGVGRELREETGLKVKILELIEVFERIFPDKQGRTGRADRPQYHFVILDYLCEVVSGEPRPGGDVTDIVFAGEDELGRYHLTPAATRVLRKAFALARSRAAK